MAQINAKEEFKTDPIEWEFAKFFFEKFPKESKMEKDFLISGYFTRDPDYNAFKLKYPSVSNKKYFLKRKKFKGIKNSKKHDEYLDAVKSFCEQYNHQEPNAQAHITPNDLIARLKHSVRKTKDDKGNDDLIMSKNKTFYTRNGGVLGKGAFGTVKMSLTQNENKIKVTKAVEIPVGFYGMLTLLDLQNEAKLSKQVFDSANLTKRATNLKDKGYLEMEYLSGIQLPEPINDQDIHTKEKLDTLLKRHGYEIDDCGQALLVIRLMEALLMLHQHHRIIHNDLKPENIKIDIQDNGDIEVHILDFGVSRALPHDKNFINPKIFSGNLVYSSPEKINDNRIGFESDTWAVGKICEVIFGTNAVISKYMSQHPLMNKKSTEEASKRSHMPVVPQINKAEETIPGNNDTVIPSIIYQELLNPDPLMRPDLQTTIALALHQMSNKIQQNNEHPLRTIFDQLLKRYDLNQNKLEVIYKNMQIISLLNQRHAQLYYETHFSGARALRNPLVDVFMQSTNQERELKDNAVKLLINKATSFMHDGIEIKLDNLIESVRKELETDTEALQKFEQGISEKSAHVFSSKSAISDTFDKIKRLENMREQRSFNAAPSA